MAQKKTFVANQLEQKAILFEERSKVYGANYKHFGQIMKGMFPDGLVLQTEEEFNRIGLLVMLMSKFSRYANNFKKGGHRDSLDDIAVYSMMTAECDEMFSTKKVKK
jgi:hypothetical protein